MNRTHTAHLILVLLLVVLYQPYTKFAYAVTAVESCGVLNVTGETYYLKKNIVASLPGYCININANNITLDCKWFSITGNGEQLGVVLNSVSGVTVKNCTIEKFKTGLVDVTGNQNTIERNTSRYNEDTGFSIQADSNKVFHNIAYENGTTGIGIKGSNNDVYYNRAYSNKQDGIVLFDNGSNYVFKNLAQNNNFSGILVNNSDMNQIIRNRTNSNLQNGVYTLGNSNKNLIAGNNAEFNSEYGFKDNTVINNVVDNDYLRNTCKSNAVGGSTTSNLCEPQP
jgi:parallel beta-helix repeat protein